MNNYLTQDAIQKLQEEIEQRKVVVRKRINEDLKEARAHGDLSENYEYKAAKKDRAQNEGRIRYLEKMVRTAIVIEEPPEELDVVGIGKKVALTFIEDCEFEEFTIVTTIEADPMEFRISLESPLGRALFNHRKGDVVLVESPQGSYEVKIENICCY
ncbi:MAG: greA [Firmicutes bacterium]|nr:greA [Bacillota bacterium]